MERTRPIQWQRGLAPIAIFAIMATGIVSGAAGALVGAWEAKVLLEKRQRQIVDLTAKVNALDLRTSELELVLGAERAVTEIVRMEDMLRRGSESYRKRRGTPKPEETRAQQRALDMLAASRSGLEELSAGATEASEKPSPLLIPSPIRDAELQQSIRDGFQRELKTRMAAIATQARTTADRVNAAHGAAVKAVEVRARVAERQTEESRRAK